jgi:hypothetical protein
VQQVQRELYPASVHKSDITKRLSLGGSLKPAEEPQPSPDIYISRLRARKDTGCSIPAAAQYGGHPLWRRIEVPREIIDDLLWELCPTRGRCPTD